MLKYAYTEIPIYEGNLYIIISDEEDKLERIFKFDIDELFSHTSIKQFRGKRTISIILNPNHKDTKLDYGNVVHEIIHAVNYIARTADIKPDLDNDEAFAYLAGWVGNFVFTKLNQWEVKLK